MIWSYQKLNVFSFVPRSACQNPSPNLAASTTISTIFLISVMFIIVSYRSIIHETQVKSALFTDFKPTISSLCCIYEVSRMANISILRWVKRRPQPPIFTCLEFAAGPLCTGVPWRSSSLELWSETPPRGPPSPCSSIDRQARLLPRFRR